jgi:Na+/phosphate symporter
VIWLTIKKYWTLASGLLITLGSSLLTLLLLRSRQNRKDAKEARARVEHAKRVMEKDVEIEREHDKRTEDLADDIENGSSNELSDPNNW